MATITYATNQIAIAKDLVFGWRVMSTEGWVPISNLSLSSLEMIKEAIVWPIFPDELRAFVSEEIITVKTRVPAPVLQNSVLMVTQKALKTYDTTPFKSGGDYLYDPVAAAAYCANQKKSAEEIMQMLCPDEIRHSDGQTLYGMTITMDSSQRYVLAKPDGSHCGIHRQIPDVNCLIAFIIACFW